MQNDLVAADRLSPSKSIALCEECGVSRESETPGFFVCKSCGSPHFRGDLSQPFDVFQMAPSFHLSVVELDRYYFDWSRKLHPDRFAARGSLMPGSTQVALRNLARSQRLSAALNTAYTRLKFPVSRLNLLLEPFIGLEKSVHHAVPLDLSEALFELQELEGAEREASRQALTDLLEQRLTQLESSMNNLASQMNWAVPDHTKIIQLLRDRASVNYIRSIQRNL